MKFEIKSLTTTSQNFKTVIIAVSCTQLQTISFHQNIELIKILRVAELSSRYTPIYKKEL
ncbi:MAG: hypothetical protein Q8N83_02370 [Ignavibacteria bacterium]|nr:hypothetical protein [Ignavibacteria bacterium]